MPTGRKAHIGVAKETTFGTAVAATDYLRYRSEDLFLDIEDVTPRNILGVPFRGASYQGLRTARGNIVFDTHPNVLGWFLLSAVGPVTTVQDEVGVRWTHTFAARTSEFAAACWLQPLTIENHKDIGQAFQFAGAVVDELELSFGAVGADEKVLAARTGIIAKSMARITATTPSFETTQPFRWHQAAVTLPDPTAYNVLQSLRIVVSNNQDGLPLVDGSTTVARIRGGDEPTVVQVSGRALATDAELTEWLNGTERYLKVVFTGATLGTGNFKLEIRCPKFRYAAYPVRVQSAGELFVDFEGEAKYDAATADTPIKVILTNSKSAY